ncbi:hypothetical protein ACTUL6_000136 [Yersinia enterocolitica]
MGCVIDMALPRLIERGKGDPGNITDLLLAGGYTKKLSADEWVKATADACRTWRELELPYGGEPETPAQIIGCYLNEIVDEALNATGANAVAIAAAVINAGFKREVAQ